MIPEGSTQQRAWSNNTNTQEIVYQYESSTQRSVWAPPPPQGCYKLNTDGSSPSKDQTHGRAQHGPTELHGIWKGLQMLDNLELEGSVLETDSKPAHEWVTGKDEKRVKSKTVAQCWDIIIQCRRLKDKNNIVITLVSGDANRCADKLAKMAKRSLGEGGYEVLYALPDELSYFVAKDVEFIG
ncbi:hypothetical protein QVD17_18494 [Tagetes erecta]|uniref:RNase H type-1 domain-containing protein n=1 Tax=Tagetes erecta TaxID=13708 RepID=A0AAD8NVT9_TARER|nr:hypothetical protein QVD17_18494 [Tagetes erecta]